MPQPERVSVQQPPKRRISKVVAGFMVIVALVLDLLQFLLTLIPLAGEVVSMFIGVFAACLFGIWFLLQGVSYFSGKQAGLKIAAAFGSVITELIPIIDALPAITAGVIAVIFASWIEDIPKEKALHQTKVISRFARMKNRSIGPGRFE